MILSTAVVESTLRVCEGAATPRALTVAILLRYGEWDQLVSLRVDPMRYDHAESYYRDAVVTELLRKVQGLPLTVNLHEEAIKSFFESEAQCYRTNERLSPYLEGGSHPLYDERIGRIVRAARKKMTQIIGRPEKTNQGHFGPGATFADRGANTTVAHKMSSNPVLTTLALPFMFDWVDTQWAKAVAAREDSSFSIVRGNRFTSVPKDSTKNRGICIEPSVNLYYQLGVGAILKKRLRATGIELAVPEGPYLPNGLSGIIGLATGIDGQERHKRKARDASSSGSHATVDLSSASDTVCSNIVKLLLPDDWYEILSDLRSPYTLMGDNWVKLEKFSSMGNGYTFELETLIFLCLIMGLASEMGLDYVIGEDVLVYGDDIIVPSEFAGETLAMLKFFGFTPNERKTFCSGHFRESCGGDYFQGANVRPYNLEGDPCEPQELIAYANGLVRLGDRDFISDHFRRHLRRAWFCVLDAIPSHIRRCRGPEHLGDIVIHDHPDYWGYLHDHGDSQMSWIRVYRPARFRRVTWDNFTGRVQLACATLGYGDGTLGIIPRDSVSGYKVGRVSVS
ncbi:TPA_asm: RNA-directed RNA polymerase [ssRNA phage SRR5466725_17]|uniref:RNA-directed RNA polymerase n=1 Tax=ssRNA phage SRR5466725_17 TaxID=2786415 RepID=A0A8S5L056_9VIRU|nr:RNA-directed RNA polymerase [ssRNA phage SRR5466725_17]DAD50836.1 TPA_asm: RNA-directed RNA polymerase [ssRNA phage SRR5466725_17]